ncbi:DUF202 domain-containing protein [Janibacter corallicola]|uniref:DUF202 domain-containing protein n=1 Tax=Janibacter corallicola TaxID=415212 RepID=UPI0012ED4C46|nr:DUF202 domain-containing protein [Janibacter corallicola]
MSDGGAPVAGPAHTPPPGFQPERTVLAWQRTALACAAGAALIARHTATVLGPIVLVIFTATLALSVVAFVLGRHRYEIAADEPSRRRDGRAPAALAFAVLALAMTELLSLTLQEVP